MIRVLVVDDSAFMRKIIGDLFSKSSDFELLDTAKDGREAIAKVKALKPDVVTLDIEMPNMDGLTALGIIMKECPVPVVMISSLTQKGAQATMEALNIGAVNFVAKAGGPISKIDPIEQEILNVCREASTVNLNKMDYRSTTRVVQPKRIEGTKSSDIPSGIIRTTSVAANTSGKVIAIGTSTGGPKALQEVITSFPKGLSCPVVIVQHMPAGFTKSLADRLNTISQVRVKEAEPNDLLMPGVVYIAPGEFHMRFKKYPEGVRIVLSQDALVNGHRPAADPMFESISEVFGKNVIGAVLTGMGSDGARGLKKIRDSGGYTVAEDSSTAIVYGMPKVAFEIGAAAKILPITSIANDLVKAI